jgi:ketosteroid isomerase-like protein
MDDQLSAHALPCIPQMSDEHVHLARTGYAALAAGDLDRVLEIIDPGIVLEVHTGRPDLPETQKLHGHAGFRENIGALTEVFENIEVIPETFIDLGDQLIVEIRTVGHGRASGIRVENRVVHIWTIRDGKATRFRVFATRQEALDELGLSERDIPAGAERPG